MREVDSVVLGKLLSSTPAVLRIVDIREESEVAECAIPSMFNPIHIPRGALERDIAKHCPNIDAPLVLVCQGGMRSTVAAKTLVGT